MNFFISIISFLTVIVFSYQDVYADASIFYVKKSLKMENDEQPKHDYYLNAGQVDGLKRGMVVKVYRKIPFQDTGIVKLNEELQVNVMELKLIHVQDKLSVGRVFKSLIGDESPVLDYSAIMIGDQVSIASKRWPKKGEAKVSMKPKSKPQPSQEKPVEEKSFASKSPEKMENKTEQKIEQKKEIEKDQRARQEVPVNGEFRSGTTL
ncbi:MAG: hypothetical protein CL674_00420 [Bdellovibrionaceae bacterium]|nr:hypothetical protein [Pseudobdellovibrionaceae bacterium]